MYCQKKKFLLRKAVTLFIAVCLFMSLIPVSSAQENKTALAAPFGGTVEEWGEIDSNYVVSANELVYFKAFQKSGTLYLCVKGEVIHKNYEFYIDADDDVTTGMDMSGIWRNGAGIDLKIAGERVYKFRNELWEEAGSATVVKSETVLEVSVNLSQFGLDGTSRIKAAFVMEENNYLPEPSRDMLTVEGAPKLQFAPEVNLDGNDEEWKSLGPLTVGMDTEPYDSVKDLYAFRTGNDLYLMVHVTTYDALGIKANIYIDTDNNPETGYQNWGQFANAGGDILVQDGNLYRHSGEGWAWTEICTGEAIYVISSEPDEDGIYTMEIKVDLSNAGELPETVKLAFELENMGYAPPIWRGNSYLAVPNLPPPINIVPDGDDSDWFPLAPVAEGQDGVKDLYAIRKRQKLYVMAHAKEYDVMNIYIDTDNNPQTGYQNWGQYAKAGSDFLVQGTSLFRHNGGGWDWTEVSTDVVRSISAEPDSEGYYTIEVEVNLDYMGDISETLKLSFEIENIGWAPRIWSNLDYATVQSATDSNPVVIDGDDSEWSRVDTVSYSSDTDTGFYAVMDYTRLFTLIKGDNLNLNNTYYIDADNSSQTGYQSEYWSNSGIDYKIDKGVLYKFTGTQENPEWERTGMVYMNTYPAYVEMYLNLKQIGLNKPQDVKVGYVGKNSIVIPQKGNEMMSVNKAVYWELEANTYYPAEIFELLNNPYIGWVPWAKEKSFDYNEELPQPHSLVYAGMTWREIEPEKGVYKWDELEEKYQFEFWAERGKKFNLRFIMDTPSDTLHMDIPDWLYEELNTHPDGAGQFYDTVEIGKGFTPNYNNPLLIEYHEKLIQEFARRYDNDPRVAYIQLGSLGHWAEWHNWPEDKTGKFPNLDVSDQYVQHYLDNFKNTLIGMRKPYPIASENNLGLFNDMFGEKGSTDSWLEWTRTGWNEIYLYVNEGQDPLEVQAASAMPDFWKYSFSGGEFYNGNAALSLTDDRIMESLRQVRESHTSWLGPCSPAIYEKDCEIQHNIDILHKTMGYRYVIESVTHAKKVNPGEELQISMIWNNKGVAPFYYDWPIEFSLADSSGKVAASFILDDIKLNEILPGKTSINLTIEIPEKLKQGTYTLCIAILDPSTSEPGVQFAIEGKRADGRYELDSIQVGSVVSGDTGSGGSASPASGGTAPIIVDGKIVYAGEVSIGELPDGRKNNILFVKSSIINAFPDVENPVITIHIPGSEKVKTSVLTGATIREMENRKAVIEIITDMASYIFPAEELSINDLENDFGRNVDLADIKVSITIAEANDAEIQEFTKAANKHSAYLVGTPVAFRISAEFDDKTVEINRFSQYVTRLIKVPYDVNYEEISTAVALDEDGTLRHVPTKIVEIEGEYFAEIRSLTNSLYSLIRKSVEFADCKGHYANDIINDLASRLIISGVGNNNYAPDRDVTRAEFAIIISRASGLINDETESLFKDVNTSDWYYSGIISAAEYGIIYGYGDGNFGPNDKISRQQAMAMITRAMNVAGSKIDLEPDETEITLSKFNDANDIADYFRESVAACIDAKIVAGRAGAYIAPNDNLTRAEAAIMVSKLLRVAGLMD